jgi:hypothetical protein
LLLCEVFIEEQKRQKEIVNKNKKEKASALSNEFVDACIIIGCCWDIPNEFIKPGHDQH